jgi:hypothetical protein
MPEYNVEQGGSITHYFQSPGPRVVLQPEPMLFELKELLVEVQSFSKPLLAFGNKLSLGMSQDFFEMLSHQSGGNSTADGHRFTQIEL